MARGQVLMPYWETYYFPITATPIKVILLHLLNTLTFKI